MRMHADGAEVHAVEVVEVVRVEQVDHACPGARRRHDQEQCSGKVRHTLQTTRVTCDV
jgi:hypothetical protein